MPDGASADDLAALRLRVLGNGWLPVPVTAPDYRHPAVRSPGKQPFFKGWRGIRTETLTPELVAGWTRSIGNHTNTGLVCGRLVGLDCDVPEPDLAARIRAAVEAILGPTPFVRTGRAPKLLLCYRVAEPVAKAETPELFVPGGVKVQVEALAEGQQFVAYGLHPDTGAPYAWLDAAPHTHPFAGVPETTPEALAALLGAAEGILRAAGAREAPRPQ